MIEREIAWRVFAHEFNHSDYFFHEGDERSPNYLVSPTGARINRLYFVGVLTEIDNIGVGEDVWRGRVSDPTGAFTVYAGQYQPEAAVFLSGLEIPSFLAVVGKARIYEPEEGNIYTSVRPEELNTADAGYRDRWIVDTARLTFERIRLVEAALKSGLKGEELAGMLMDSGTNAELANGISLAVGHYADLTQYLKTLEAVIIDALQTLLPPGHGESVKKDISGLEEKTAPGDIAQDACEIPKEDAPIIVAGSEYPKVKESRAGYSAKQPQPVGATTPPEPEKPTDTAAAVTEENEPDADEIVYELMGRLDTGGGVTVADLTDESRICGLTDHQVDEAVKILMSEGKCYEPRIGLLRRV